MVSSMPRVSVAVSGGGGGVDEAGIPREGPFGEGLGVTVVIGDEVVAVGFGGRGAGTEVKDTVDAAEGVGVGGDAGEKFVGLEVVVETERGEIPPFLVVTEGVGDEDVVDAAGIEFLDHGAADEPGGSGDENAGTFTRGGFLSSHGVMEPG